MGWCKFPGQDWEPGWTSEACAAGGGQYSEGNPSAICFVRTILTRSLGEAILELGQTYDTAVAFRDKILSSTPEGKRLVALYYRHNPAMVGRMSGDYELMGESIATWVLIVPFIEGMVESGKKAGSKDSRDLQFTRDMHERVVGLLDRLAGRQPDESLAALIEQVKAESAKFVGRTPKEALETFLVPPIRRRRKKD